MDTLREIAAADPDTLFPLVSQIGDFVSSRRWYELGARLVTLLQQDAVSGSRRLIFESVIYRHCELIDPFHYAELILSVASEAATPDDALDFLCAKNIRDTKLFDRNPQPKDLLNLRCVRLHTEKGDFESALKLLLEIESRISEATPLVVRSSFHSAQSNLDKARGDCDAFCAHAFLYLSTAGPIADAALARDLCVAALLSDGVCSFGELAAHSIVKSLADTESQWLLDLVMLLGRGDPDSVAVFAETFVPLIQESDVFAPHIDAIQRKLSLAVFLQVIFQRPFDSRVFSFNEIAEACHIPKDQVELLVLKALATDIIQGSLDEVQEKVVVTWCKPKALGSDRLQHLKQELDRWIQIVHIQRVNLKDRAQPVVEP
jgi:26S proteasome regulatory subunit N9